MEDKIKVIQKWDINTGKVEITTNDKFSYIEYLTIEEIIERFKDELTEEQLEKLNYNNGK